MIVAGFSFYTTMCLWFKYIRQAYRNGDYNIFIACVLALLIIGVLWCIDKYMDWSKAKKAKEKASRKADACE